MSAESKIGHILSTAVDYAGYTGAVNNPWRRAPQHLIEDPQQVLNHTYAHGMVELFRNGDRGIINVGEVVRQSMSLRPNELAHYLVDEVRFHSRLDVAGRRINGWLEAVTSDETPCSQMLERAYEDPNNASHGSPHKRRHKLHVKKAIGETPALRHEASIEEHLEALFGAVAFHDLDQLTVSLRNHDARKGGDPTRLTVKEGHSPAGAALPLIFYRQLARAAKLSDDPAEAWATAKKIALEIAVITLDHDEMDVYAKSLRGAKKAYDANGNPLDDGTLLALFESKELDKFSLSPADVLRLSRLNKMKKPGFVNPEDPYDTGHHPLIQDEYREVIEELMHDYSRPLDGLGHEEKNASRRTGELFAIGDEREKSVPANLSSARTLSTQYSTRRPFMIPESVQTLLNEIRHGRGQPTSEYDCDTIRILFEIYHQEDVIQDPFLLKSEHIRNYARDSAIMRGLAFRSIGEEIMKGNLGHIYHLYETRMMGLAQKALERAGFESNQVNMILDQAERGNIEGGRAINDITRKVAILDHKLALRFKGMATSLLDEAGDIISAIRCKPHMPGQACKDENETDARIYTEQEIGTFKHLVNSVVADLCVRHNLCSQEEVDAWLADPEGVSIPAIQYYENLLEETEFPPDTPFRRYDSLADPHEDRRTVHPLTPAPVSMPVYRSDILERV